MSNHTRSTTGRIAANHLVRIGLVAVVLLSAIGASGALAQPAAAEPGSHSGITDAPAAGGPNQFPDETFSVDDSTYIQWPQPFSLVLHIGLGTFDPIDRGW